jgi:hypothetical protein
LEAFPYVEPNCKNKNHSWLRRYRRHDRHGDPAKRPGSLRAEENLQPLRRQKELGSSATKNPAARSSRRGISLSEAF